MGKPEEDAESHLLCSKDWMNAHHFNENVKVQRFCLTLPHGEPQILEVFKNTLPTKLYWILFPIEDLRQPVDTAKRILTKEKLDK